jgi:Bacterial Ig-like domain (group 2)
MTNKALTLSLLLCTVPIGSQLLTAQTVRVPERVCLAENYTSTATTCILPKGIPAGDGVVVFGTVPNTADYDMSTALKDSKGNSYTQLESQVYDGNQSGTIYMWYSQLTTALVAGDTVTLSPLPDLDSWNFSVYDIGPVSAADVGVVFSNSDIGVAGTTNPATGVPGWWTGQTTNTTGAKDICMAGMTVNSTGGGGAPAPITTYTIDNGFLGLDIVDFHAGAAPTSSSPNYNGGSLMTMYVEVGAGTAVQSHVVTASVDDQAASVMFCFAEASGSTAPVPYFTGNYCTGTSSCTLNNVKAGDMLVISTHTLDVNPPLGPATVVDSLGETAVFDAANAAADIRTWHISPVQNAGTHTITVNNFGTSGLLVSAMEIAGQAASGNPVEAIAQNLLNSGDLATLNMTTINGNDLLYAWGRGADGSDEGDGFTSARVAPTAEYAVAPAAGAQPISIVPRGALPETDLGIQAIAIRPAGSSQPATSIPQFTGNYCLSNTSATCSISNVHAGDMLVVSIYWTPGNANDKPVLVDSQTSEVITLDRQNDFDGTDSLATWHIGQVATAGTHAFSITGASPQSPHMSVVEFSGQDPAAPTDVAPVGATGTGTLASTSLTTASANDLIYAWCNSINGAGTGNGFAAIGTDPTSAYRIASATPGTETATCPISSTGPWAIEEIAIKGTVSSNNGAPLVSIAVTPANPSLPKGETQQFTATGTFADKSTENVTNAVIWTSSNTAVATVSTSGLGGGVAVGGTTITASSGSISGSTELTVAAPALESIAVTPANSSLAQNGTLQFTATGTYSDGSTQNVTSSVTWVSTNTAAATINTVGLGTGVAPGSTTITATSGVSSGSTGLTVTPVLVSIAVTPANASIPEGGTLQFTATGTYSDNSTKNVTNSVTWSSTNTAAATINSSGLGTGVAPGSTTITATSGAVNGATGLTVTAVTLVSIAITPANTSVMNGATLQFTATGTYSNNSTENLTGSVTWTSSSAAVATISSSGLATGVGGGTTSIGAALSGISNSTNLTVSTAFPGITYDTWVDFEQCATGVAPTVACLASSTHGTAGTWDVSQIASLITIQSAAADPGTADGNNATRGMAYNLANGGTGYLQWTPPSQLSSLSLGFWYKTGQPANWSGGPQFITLYNNAYGPTFHLSDERSAANNARQINAMPAGAAVTGIADNTWYWITMKWVQKGAGTLSVYDSTLSLVGSVNFTDTSNSAAQIIRVGNASATSAQSGESSYFDDVILDYTNVQFPVLPAKVTRSLVSIAVTPANASIAAGNTQQFTATGTYNNGSTANLTASVTWASSNAAAATISTAGLGNGVAIGSTTITATSGAISGSTGLTVTAPVLVSIAVTPANSSIAPGANQQFAATGTYSDSSTRNLTGTVTWTSSNTAAATISSSGLGTGVATGSTTINATSGTISGSTTLTVIPVLVSIAVTPANASIPAGGVQQFTATGTYSDNSTKNVTNSVTWSSTNTAAATITSSGLGTGVAPGSATITATSGAISGSTGLTVTAVTLVSIAVTPVSPSIAKGATQQFTATGTYSDRSTENLTSSVTWTSGTTSVATISSSGLATGTGGGSTSIGAALGGISNSTTLTVTTAFPGISYDTWVDFEQCPTAAAPTAACLASSTHGTAGTWNVSKMASLISIQSAAADPGTADGNHATRGMAYNLANGSEGYLEWTPPNQVSSLSFGLWYKTGQPASWVEGPHLITIYNNTFGNMLRLSDERSSGNNARQIRVSPLDAAVTGISDNTWYWVTMKWVQNGAGTFSVYNTSLQLLGSVNFTDPYNYPAQIIELGNTSATPGESGESTYFDDVILDYTTVNFPVLPQ